MPDRPNVLSSMRSLLEEKAVRARAELAELDQASAQETKSSAGDKYETAREMIAQARELQSSVLGGTQLGIEWLERQDPSRTCGSIALGAIFQTSDGWFLACPLPMEIPLRDGSVQGISLQSPLGQCLKGASAGGTRVFRGKTVQILAVV